MAIWANFGDMLNFGLRGPISGSLWISKYNMIRIFSHFLKHFPSVSHPFCFKCLLGFMFMCIRSCISAWNEACYAVRPLVLSIGKQLSTRVTATHFQSNYPQPFCCETFFGLKSQLGWLFQFCKNRKTYCQIYQNSRSKYHQFLFWVVSIAAW